MLAKTLLLALLVGAAGGGLAAWALTAAGGVGPADTAIPIETESAPVRSADRPETGDASLVRADPGPTLQGSQDAASSDAAWREVFGARMLRIEEQLDDLAQRVSALDDGTTEPDLDAPPTRS